MQPPSPPPGAVPGQPQQPQNALGITSLVLGIASFPLLCCFSIGILTGIAAVVTGFLAKGKAEQGLATNRGMAMAGLICGAVAAALGVILIIIALTTDLSYDYTN
jgi:hypothetical protein